MDTIILICTITFVVGCTVMAIAERKDLYAMLFIGFLIAVTSFIIGTIRCGRLESYDLKDPTALDVYRGKTTLEITYRDSVAVDSVVVYKAR